jgi:hypothetical protein
MQVRIVENVWHEGRVLTEGEVHESPTKWLNTCWTAA